MEKFQHKTDPYAVRSRPAGDPAGEERNSDDRREEDLEPYTPEKMIRDLQGIFCKGRYRSWAFTQARLRK